MKTVPCVAVAIFIVGAASSAVWGEALSPRSFVDRSGNLMPVAASFTVSKGDGLATEPWPFTATKVVFFCARPALAAYGFDGKFGSLNGSTSSYATRGLMLVDADGSRRPIISASDNRLQVEGGLIAREASNMEIGSWHAAMLDKLLAVCQR